jgi:S2P endopeptidase
MLHDITGARLAYLSFSYVCITREKVRVNGFGVFVLALYPGAFVDISTDQLQTATPLQQLRIYCAGVWHNFVIVIVAIIALFLLPTLLVPLYTSGEAAFVTYVAEVLEFLF